MQIMNVPTWTLFKNLVTSKSLLTQYNETDRVYNLFASEDSTFLWSITLLKDGEDAQDFEVSYKNTCNQPLEIKDSEGRFFIRAESRPISSTTCFTMAGDLDNSIGTGKELKWDFSTSEDEIAAPEGYKRKRLEFNFIDDICIKEGTLYFFNAPKGCFIDFFCVCPTGNYYLKNDGTPTYASEDVVVSHYVIKHHMTGDCPLGDELNTEAASSKIPSIYKFWIEITIPETNINAYGYISIELYRVRTVVL